MQTVPLPTIGTVAGRPRKESLFDTEGHNNAVAPGNLNLFRNFGAFATAGLAEAKAFGRDTNLTGSGGSLPKAHHFFWHGIRAKIRSLGTNLTTAANHVVPEEINRLREYGQFRFNFGTTPYIITQLDEIPSGVGPQFLAVSKALAADVMLPSLPNGVPTRTNYYDVTVFDPRVNAPSAQQITEQEQFSVDLLFAGAALPVPTVELYHTVVLVGVYIKGITG